jgi:hypothetical protein
VGVVTVVCLFACLLVVVAVGAGLKSSSYPAELEQLAVGKAVLASDTCGGPSDAKIAAYSCNSSCVYDFNASIVRDAGGDTFPTTAPDCPLVGTPEYPSCSTQLFVWPQT